MLDACIQIIEKNPGYDALPSFEKLRLLYDRLSDEEGADAHEEIGYIGKGKKKKTRTLTLFKK